MLRQVPRCVDKFVTCNSGYEGQLLAQDLGPKAINPWLLRGQRPGELTSRIKPVRRCNPSCSPPGVVLYVSQPRPPRECCLAPRPGVQLRAFTPRLMSVWSAARGRERLLMTAPETSKKGSLLCTFHKT